MKGVLNPAKDDESWVEYFDPECISPAGWQTVRPWVLEQMLRLCMRYESVSRQCIRLLALIADWSVRQGLPLETDIVLSSMNVPAFFDAEENEAYGKTYRWRLEQLARILSTRGGWVPRPKPRTKRLVTAPYSPEEFETFTLLFGLQSTHKRNQNLTAFFILGGLLGLNGTWAGNIRPEHIVRIQGMTVCRVPEPGARLVAVEAAWESFVWDFARSVRTDYLINTKSTEAEERNACIRHLAFAPGVARITLPRLRSTWIVRHIQRGTRLPELAAAANVSDVTSMSDLLHEVPRLPTNDYLRQLRGPS